MKVYWIKDEFMLDREIINIYYFKTGDKITARMVKGNKRRRLKYLYQKSIIYNLVSDSLKFSESQFFEKIKDNL